jgi:hypothetical protein
MKDIREVTFNYQTDLLPYDLSYCDVTYADGTIERFKGSGRLAQVQEQIKIQNLRYVG